MTRYGLEIFHQCDKSLKTRSQGALEAKSYICKAGSRDGGDFPPILSGVNIRAIHKRFFDMLFVFVNCN